MPSYVPAGPRADALINLAQDSRGSYVAGLPGKVAVFRMRLGRMPFVRVAVVPPRDFLFRPFDPNDQGQYMRAHIEEFEAIEIRNDQDRLWAYVNEPRHLDEFLTLVNGPKYTVVVRDVQRKALPPLADPDPA